MADPVERPSRPDTAFAPAAPGIPLALELGGDIPCVRCRYNLKGLSIRGACPECGTPMRATLLAVVDPRASELQPIEHPRLVATGVLLWSLAALAATACEWSVRFLALTDPSHAWLAPGSAARLAASGLVLLSGLGAAAFIRPHAAMPRPGTLLAAIGVGLFVPLAAVMAMAAHILLPIPSPGEWTITARGGLDGLLGTAQGLLLIGILLLLRPNARLLAARSLLMREGMVDRQTMRAVAATLFMCVLGHLLGVLAAGSVSMEMPAMIGGALVAIGYMLFFMGLVGIAIDCLRMRRVIASPPLSPADLLEPARTRAADRPSRQWTR
jgi:hypothetical protein